MWLFDSVMCFALPSINSEAFFNFGTYLSYRTEVETILTVLRFLPLE